MPGEIFSEVKNMLYDVKRVLLRAATDPEYRSRILGSEEHRAEALKSYNLTDEERTCLLELTEDSIADAASKLNHYAAVSDIRI
jgi:hypothetical protein